MEVYEDISRSAMLVEQEIALESILCLGVSICLIARAILPTAALAALPTTRRVSRREQNRSLLGGRFMPTTAAEGLPQPGMPIPLSPAFPVKWEKSGDEQMFWVRDLTRYPYAMAPLEFEYLYEMYVHGCNYAAKYYELPVRFDARYINGYFYGTFIPIGTSPEPIAKLICWLGWVAPSLDCSTECSTENKAAVAQTMEKCPDKLSSAIFRLDPDWNTKFLPKIKEHLSYWENFDLREASMPQLLSHLQETKQRVKHLGEIRFLIGFPLRLAMSLFEDPCRELFDDENALTDYRLLQGLDNKTLESDRKLWQLSRKAMVKPEVRKVLEERAAADVVGGLEKTTEGEAFLSELRGFLEEYGQRGHRYAPIGDVSWIEDPTPVIKNLKDCTTQLDRDPTAEAAALAAERVWLVYKAREQLERHPEHVKHRFDSLLKAAQDATVLQENRTFWIDFRSFYQVRRVLQEFGRRFAESGVIAKQNDVFYLNSDELRETAEVLPGLDQHRLITERKSELERFRAIEPPPAIGRMPFPESPDDAVVSAIEQCLRKVAKSQTDPSVLPGNAGSPGKVRGPAKVVRSLAEDSKLQKGDVLVAETIAPSWTSLFGIVSAVVTDAGNDASYGVAAARKYRIPAVVGTGTATATIQDGQCLEVDGDTGLVRIVEQE